MSEGAKRQKLQNDAKRQKAESCRMRRLRAVEAQLEALYEMLDTECPDLQKVHAETIAKVIDTCICEVEDEIHELLQGHLGGTVASNTLMIYIEGAACGKKHARCRGDTPQASQVVQHTTDATNLPHNLPKRRRPGVSHSHSREVAQRGPQDCAAQECRICNRTENIRICALCTKGFCDNNHACVIGHWKLCDGGRRKAKDDQDEADGCEATQEYLHQRWKEEMGSNLLLCHERPGVPLNESAASEQKMMQMETPQGHGFVQSVIAHLGQLEAERYRVMLGFETETVEDIKYDPDSWLITYLRGELKEKISELKELGRKR